MVEELNTNTFTRRPDFKVGVPFIADHYKVDVRSGFIPFWI